MALFGVAESGPTTYHYKKNKHNKHHINKFMALSQGKNYKCTGNILKEPCLQLNRRHDKGFGISD